jgi:hypothetical protein
VRRRGGGGGGRQMNINRINPIFYAVFFYDKGILYVFWWNYATVSDYSISVLTRHHHYYTKKPM